MNETLFDKIPQSTINSGRCTDGIRANSINEFIRSKGSLLVLQDIEDTLLPCRKVFPDTWRRDHLIFLVGRLCFQLKYRVGPLQSIGAKCNLPPVLRLGTSCSPEPMGYLHETSSVAGILR